MEDAGQQKTENISGYKLAPKALLPGNRSSSIFLFFFFFFPPLSPLELIELQAGGIPPGRHKRGGLLRCPAKEEKTRKGSRIVSDRVWRGDTAGVWRGIVQESLEGGRVNT